MATKTQNSTKSTTTQTEQLFELFMAFIEQRKAEGLEASSTAPKAIAKKSISPKGPKVTVDSHKKGRRHIKDGVLDKVSVSLLRRGNVFQLSPKGAQYKVTGAISRGTKSSPGTMVPVDHPKVTDGYLAFGDDRTVYMVR